jgi:hypothetical protein
MRWGSGNDQAMAKEARKAHPNVTPGFELNELRRTKTVTGRDDP